MDKRELNVFLALALQTQNDMPTSTPLKTSPPACNNRSYPVTFLMSCLNMGPNK